MSMHSVVALDRSVDFTQLVAIRPLKPDDSRAYRELRMRVLAMGDGKYFSDSYARESRFITEEQWRAWCTETQEHCTIGIFYNGELIGIMGIVRYGLPQNSTVEWEVTWLDPEYRNYGIAKSAYEKVREWTIRHGYKYAVVFIRADNVRSREIREKQGAVYIDTKHNEVWADGSVADVNRFVIDLSPTTSQQGRLHHHAIRNLEAIFASLESEDSLIKNAL